MIRVTLKSSAGGGSWVLVTAEVSRHLTGDLEVLSLHEDFCHSKNLSGIGALALKGRPWALGLPPVGPMGPH